MRVLGRISLPWPKGLNERFQWELNDVREYLKLAERHLKNTRKKLADKYERETAQMSEAEEKQAFIDSYYDFMRLDEIFPRIGASTTFLGIYSLLEHQLMLVCGEIQASLKHPVAVEDMRGSGIDRCKLYCEKVGGVEFPTSIPEWWHLQRYRWIRNAIVHANGRLEPDTYREVRDFLKDAGTAKLNQNDEIILSYQFCYEVLENVQGFMDELTAFLLEKYNAGARKRRKAKR